MHRSKPELYRGGRMRLQRIAVLVASVIVTVAVAAPAQETAPQAPTSHILSWSAPELALAGIFATSMWIDAAQSREAMRRGYYERGALLRAIGGNFPSATVINLYGFGMTTLTIGTASLLPRPWRSILLIGATALETRIILRTASIGVAVRF